MYLCKAPFVFGTYVYDNHVLCVEGQHPQSHIEMNAHIMCTCTTAVAQLLTECGPMTMQLQSVLLMINMHSAIQCTYSYIPHVPLTYHLFITYAPAWWLYCMTSHYINIHCSQCPVLNAAHHCSPCRCLVHTQAVIACPQNNIEGCVLTKTSSDILFH